MVAPRKVIAYGRLSNPQCRGAMQGAAPLHTSARQLLQRCCDNGTVKVDISMRTAVFMWDHVWGTGPDSESAAAGTSSNAGATSVGASTSTGGSNSAVAMADAAAGAAVGWHKKDAIQPRACRMCVHRISVHTHPPAWLTRLHRLRLA
jgi:hypothetical protein